MIVKSTKNEVSDLPEHLQQYAFHQYDGKLPLSPGKKYVVAGIRKLEGFDFFLVIDDDHDQDFVESGSPWWHWSGLFTVVDDYRPVNWISSTDNSISIESFPELVNDLSGQFQSNLEDGEQKEMHIFLQYYKQYAQYHDMWTKR